MENEIKKEKVNLPISSVVLVIILIVLGWIYTMSSVSKVFSNKIPLENGKVELPVKWGDMGAQMAETGVIDKEKIEALYSSRGGLSEADKKLLYNSNNGNLVITQENSGVMLNILWAFGLSNKNEILENGPMKDPRYGGAENFASTGGWNLSKGDSMDHYSMHSFITLTPEQQLLVERVSKGIFRPCCNNSTYFPDCNHGMAMLGLLELMASQGVSEANMYKFALQVNALWFPDTYQNIRTFFQSQNIDWNTIDPKRILSAEFSSGSGYQKMMSQMQPQEQKGGGAGCST